MRLLLALPMVFLLAAGCAAPPSSPKPAGSPQAKFPSAASAKPARAQSVPGPVIEPVAAFTGKVVLLNAPLKYIVVEGVIGRLPPPDHTLNVYRDGQKVGVVTVSSQTRGANFAADVVHGEVRVGDTVRSD